MSQPIFLIHGFHITLWMIGVVWCVAVHPLVPKPDELPKVYLALSIRLVDGLVGCCSSSANSFHLLLLLPSNRDDGSIVSGVSSSLSSLWGSVGGGDGDPLVISYPCCWDWLSMLCESEPFSSSIVFMLCRRWVCSAVALSFKVVVSVVDMSFMFLRIALTEWLLLLPLLVYASSRFLQS